MRKGFTLAELLAVIVLLSVLALIAVPVILDIIKDTRKDSAVRSAELYIDAAENVALYRETAGTGKREVEIGVVYNHEVLEEVFELKVDGSIPSEDSWVIFDKYGVANYSLKFGNYVISYNEATEKEEVTEGNSIKKATYSTFNLGDKVKLLFGSDTSSTWYVFDTSDSENDSTIILMKELYLEGTYSKKTTVNKNEVTPKLLEYETELNLPDRYVVKTNGKVVRLPGKDELISAMGSDYNSETDTFVSTNFWASYKSGQYYWLSTEQLVGVGNFIKGGYYGPYYIRPVIEVSKLMVVKA